MKRFISDQRASTAKVLSDESFDKLELGKGMGLSIKPLCFSLLCAALLQAEPVLAQAKAPQSPPSSNAQSGKQALPGNPSTAAAAPSSTQSATFPAAAQTSVASPAQTSEVPGVRVLLMPDVETVLVAQMVGRITALNASLGSRVTKGQVVVRFDCSENTARLKMSEAELASARDSYDNKLRLKGLDAAGDVEVALAASQVDRAKGQIEMTKAQIQACTVIAPFSGSVSKLSVKPHQGVNLGQQLFEMVSDGAPRLRLNVPSKWMRKLRTGTPFNLTIEETGKAYKANVSAINTRVDPVAQTIEIEGRVVGGAPGLLPGMSGLARFSGMPPI